MRRTEQPGRARPIEYAVALDLGCRSEQVQRDGARLGTRVRVDKHRLGRAVTFEQGEVGRRHAFAAETQQPNRFQSVRRPQTGGEGSKDSGRTREDRRLLAVEPLEQPSNAMVADACGEQRPTSQQRAPHR